MQHNLGIATNVLASRLDALVEAQILVRSKYSSDPNLFEYLVTPKGRDLTTALMALTEWGDRWAAPAGAPILYSHTTCGSPATAQIACAECGVIADPGEVQVAPGPGMPAEYLANRRGGAARR